MDIFHDAPLYAGVRQMLGAFARQYIRPVAGKLTTQQSGRSCEAARLVIDVATREVSRRWRERTTGATLEWVDWFKHRA